ncbi:histidine phosphatase family protein [Halobacillus locisalis]|uniref:Histidine phosphatase family protein n=1 Tax=Halobacillus locisalis TaxID=220753 RepID=A0A838CNP6_9BACI|nr:histidine phosphatase family protein [Halobacillus locisalis]MBA2173782.1 histidine phosphatase family protein [Halobacillus locisalis]
MNTIIYFVRHAHSTYTEKERSRPLSEHGKRDAEKVKDLLANKNIHHVLSSPYLRSIQTVEPLANEIGKEVHVIEDFKERKLIEGSAKNFSEAIERVWSDEAFSWPGGESNQVARQRGANALNDVLKKHEGERVVIGTHGNIMTLTMGALDSRFDYEFWKQLRMPEVIALTFDQSTLLTVDRIVDEEAQSTFT